MSGVACTCLPRDVRVLLRNGSRSAFNGYRLAWSAYSAIQCTKCGRCWRSKASYVSASPDAPPDWAERSLPTANKESAP